jgi:hypothetical protein
MGKQPSSLLDARLLDFLLTPRINLQKERLTNSD